MTTPSRPSKEEIAAAFGRPVDDLVGPGLRVLLCGINPSLLSAATNCHFGNPANRLWPVLHQAGFTDRRLHPSEGAELLERGIGVTNFVNRATATAAEISDDEIRAGMERLRTTVRTWRPAYLALLGLSAYRVGFGRPKASVGAQPEDFEGAKVWLLPNPSGLNAHYQLPQLVECYAALRRAALPEG